jgi:hypothetical protein
MMCYYLNVHFQGQRVSDTDTERPKYSDKPAQMPFCPPEILHKLAQAWVAGKEMHRHGKIPAMVDKEMSN